MRMIRYRAIYANAHQGGVRSAASPERYRRPMGKLQQLSGNFCRTVRGAVLVEFALVIPIFLLLMSGTVTYGGWIALAHAVQQSANEGARVALGGLTQDERADLARTRALATMRSYRVDPARVLVTVADDGTTLSVDVSYDASNDPRLALKLVLVPLPAKTIVRHSVVALSGL